MEMRYRYYFFEAFLLTVLLFIFGFFIGLSIEKARNAELSESYLNTETEIIDLGAQLDMSNLGRFTCSELVERNFDIGNQIYVQALVFQEYENAAILTKVQLVKEHRKFDALRTLFWINSIKIKDRCGNKVFDTIVYLYDYPATSIEEIAKQKVMARVTQEIKDSAESEIILVPIAKNLNISSLNSLLLHYELKNESTVLIVDEEKVFLYNETNELRAYFDISD